MLQPKKTCSLSTNNTDAAEAGIIANFSKASRLLTIFHFEDGTYVKVLDSADFAWGGLVQRLPTLAIKGDEHHDQRHSTSLFI